MALVLTATWAAGVALNERPCVVAGTGLQTYFTNIGQTIDVQNDQVGTALWTSTISNHSTFTIMLELGDDAAANAVGIYSEGAPQTRHEIFPSFAGPGWFAVASFDVALAGHVVVNLFDEHAGWQSTQHYYNVNSSAFGFYVETPGAGPSQVFFSEDDENGLMTEGHYMPQNLVFAATGTSEGSWWLTFQTTATKDFPMTFDSVVIFLESVNITATEPTTWGGIKNLYKP